MVKALEYISSDLEEVRSIIRSALHDKDASVQKTYNYLTETTGKMLRPGMVIISGMLCGEDVYNKHKHDFYKIAASVEMIHIASLVHDDVIDSAKMRRGRNTINDIYGNKHAVIIGDIIITESFRMLSSLGNIDILQKLVNVAGVLSEGEIIQERYIGNYEISLDEYLDIISKKTASLFEMALSAPFILIDKDNAHITEIGFNIGVVFQLIDDFLDYFGSDLGKKQYTDFFEQKMTLPMILLRESASDDADKVKNIFLTEKKIESMDSYFHKYGILERSKQYIDTNYLQKIRDGINDLDNDTVKELMLSVIDFINERKY